MFNKNQDKFSNSDLIKIYQDQVESDISKKYIQMIFEAMQNNKSDKEYDLEYLIENFEESIYRPNDINNSFAKPKNVYDFRIDMINNFNNYF